ncbi:MAG: malonyl-ACP O-methyltransferase BioC [Thiohalomonadaceae bacterium]
MRDLPLPDKRLVRAAFEKAASRYDEAAVLQREIGTRLLERLELMKITPRRVLEVGSGTGFCSTQLVARFAPAEFIALDIAHGMLRHARTRFGWWQRLRRRPGFICADAESLPLADASVDLLFSNLTLQWCNNPDATFAEFRRVLKPGGLLLFSTFGPDTLKELRAAWRAVDDAMHVNAFIDMHDLGDGLLRNGFADPVMDREDIVLTYGDARALMNDLKAIGAHNVNHGRHGGLTGKNKFNAMLTAYEQFRREGRLPASYEIVYGHAWAPLTPQQQTQDGATHISLAQMRANLGGPCK